MPDTSPDLYDGKLNKINGVSAHKTQQTEIYFIATSDIHITMNLIAYKIAHNAGRVFLGTETYVLSTYY